MRTAGGTLTGGTDRILTRLTGEYPISLLEDPLYREDREGIQELEKKLEDREDCEKKTVLGRRSL